MNIVQVAIQVGPILQVVLKDRPNIYSNKAFIEGQTFFLNMQIYYYYEILLL